MSRSGGPSVVSRRGNTLLSRIVKINRRTSLDDITSIFNETCPRAVSRRIIQRKNYMRLAILRGELLRHWGLGSTTRKCVEGGVENRHRGYKTFCRAHLN